MPSQQNDVLVNRTEHAAPFSNGANGFPKSTPAPDTSLVSLSDAVFQHVRVQLSANLGHAALTVEELLALRPDSVLSLDTQLNELVELRLNGSLIARGEIVAVDDNFGVRIVEVADPS